MNKKKIIRVISVAMVMIFALTGCGGRKEETQIETRDYNGRKVIKNQKTNIMTEDRHFIIEGKDSIDVTNIRFFETSDRKVCDHVVGIGSILNQEKTGIKKNTILSIKGIWYYVWIDSDLSKKPDSFKLYTASNDDADIYKVNK